MNISPTERREDKGFTLIELMVVVLIIAILLAIAIPTFLGAQNKAKDRSAQSSARNALTNAKVIYADSGVYFHATDLPLSATDGTSMIEKLNIAEPSLKFQALESAGPKEVSVLTSTATAWYGAVLSDTGTCFYIADSVAATVSGGLTAGTTYAKVKMGSTDKCAASAPSLTVVYGPKW